ncbi:MAG: hypothetical protein RL238_1587 [Actinomycetota bacterium]|jgi:uncharacterized membrane protein YeaQ/YmgE (transglycosylase-associated protein family)
MGFFSWVFVGLIAGLIGRKVTGDQKSGCLYTVAVGVLGAVIGGWLMQAIDHKGVTEFGFRSVLVAALGSILLLLVLQAIAGRKGRR